MLKSLKLFMSKYLSIDYGTKNVGLAISDDTKIFAMQLTPVRNKGSIDNILKVIRDFDVSRIVIGLPLGSNGKETAMSKSIREFASELLFRSGVEIEYWDESYTSKFASKTMRKKGSIDSESARIVLQEYLDFNNSK